MCTDSKKELDTRAKLLVKEAESPPKKAASTTAKATSAGARKSKSYTPAPKKKCSE